MRSKRSCPGLSESRTFHDLGASLAPYISWNPTTSRAHKEGRLPLHPLLLRLLRYEGEEGEPSDGLHHHLLRGCLREEGLNRCHPRLCEQPEDSIHPHRRQDPLLPREPPRLLLRHNRRYGEHDGDDRLPPLRHLPYKAGPRSSFPDTNYTFTGQEDDDGTGLYNYNARLYDPELGRFISADSIIPEPGNLQAFNRYSYCVNNPLVYVDPSGHFFGIDDILIGWQ